MQTMQKTPLLGHHHALFLDFDGTLTDIAPSPQAVQIHADLLPLLQRTFDYLGGAVAIVTGRPVLDVAQYLEPVRLPIAGEHGTQWRNSAGDTLALDARYLESALAPIRHAAARLAQLYPGLLVEQKTAGLALHYRMTPALYTLCFQTLAPLVQQSPTLALMRGKYVLEVAPSAVHKGTAIHAFMQTPPFDGRTPLFSGDDVTDEAGFEAVQSLGGHGMKVGAGPSVAHLRCASPAALREWLQHSMDTPQNQHAAYLQARAA